MRNMYKHDSKSYQSTYKRKIKFGSNEKITIKQPKMSPKPIPLMRTNKMKILCLFLK